jgi:hypothetical protein
MSVVEVPRARLIDEYVFQDALSVAMTNVAMDHLEDLIKSACGDIHYEDLIAELDSDRYLQLGLDDEPDDGTPESWHIGRGRVRSPPRCWRRSPQMRHGST